MVAALLMLGIIATVLISQQHGSQIDVSGLVLNDTGGRQVTLVMAAAYRYTVMAL